MFAAVVSQTCVNASLSDVRHACQLSQSSLHGFAIFKRPDPFRFHNYARILLVIIYTLPSIT
jgi:hypothetical protein